MQSEENIKLVENYVEGSLTPDQLSDFTLRLNADEELAREVSLQRNILAHLISQEKARRKTEMLADFRNVRHNSLPQSKRRLIWYSIAAAVLFIVGYSIWNQIDVDPYEQVFQAYYQPYDGAVLTRGTTSGNAMGINAYNSRQYDAALHLFLDAVNKSGNDGQLSLLIGSCYLSLGDPKNSLLWLDKMPKDETPMTLSNRDWFVALAYLKNRELERSRNTLEQLINSNSPYKKIASTLLNEPLFQ